MVSPLPGATPTKPGSATRPLPSGMAGGGGGRGRFRCRRAGQFAGWCSSSMAVDARTNDLRRCSTLLPTGIFSADHGRLSRETGARKDANCSIGVVGRIEQHAEPRRNRLSTNSGGRERAGGASQSPPKPRGVASRRDQDCHAAGRLRGDDELEEGAAAVGRESAGSPSPTTCLVAAWRRRCRTAQWARSCGGCCAKWRSAAKVHRATPDTSA